MYSDFLRIGSLSKVLNNLLKFIRRNPDAVMKIADIAEVVYELIVWIKPTA